MTVYPPGYVPYGRVAVAPVDLQGREVIATESDSPVAASGTIWEGTADAAAGPRWPETGGPMGSRRTQGWRLAVAAGVGHRRFRGQMTKRVQSNDVFAEALFRFRVVSEVLTAVMRGLVCGRAVKRVASRAHTELDGSERKVSARTLYRRVAAYERGGLSALEPVQRKRVTTSTVLSETLVSFLREEKKTDPLASVPELLERARERGKGPIRNSLSPESVDAPRQQGARSRAYWSM